MILVWCGPISAETMARAPWKNRPRILTISGEGSRFFASLAAGYAHAGGTPLRGLLAAHGIDPNTDEPVALAAFSAGHGLVEPILAHPADRARIAAVGAFDAYYVTHGQPPKRGYLAYAREAAEGRGRMLLTSSHNAGSDYASATDAIHDLAVELGPLSEIPRVDVGPAENEIGGALGKGNFAWYVYANRTDGSDGDNIAHTHNQHANVLAPYWMPRILEQLEQHQGDDGEPRSSAGLAFCVALFLLWLGSGGGA